MFARFFRQPPPFWLGALALLLLALAVYWPALRGPFVWDDKDWTTGMEWALRDADGLWQFWFKPGAAQQYYPLTATSFWIDYQLWGFNTLPYHLENVLLHGLSAVLFWLVLRQLGVGGAWSWFAAALYAAHPVMAESVAWITERKNVLCQALILAALLAYGRYQHGWQPEARARRPRRWWAASFLLFLAAVLAKITAFVLPPALLVIAWWKYRRLGWRRDVLPVVPMFAVSIVAGIGVAWMEMHHVGAIGRDFDLPLAGRLAIAGQALWVYLGKLLWPHPICLIYHRWELNPAQWWQWLGAAGALLAAAVLLWGTRRGQWRGITAGVLLFAGMLFPVLGFMNVYGMRFAWVADRWVYMPALVVFAWIGHVFAVMPWRKIRLTLAVAVLGTCAALTWRQAACYRSVDAFWQAAIAGNPTAWKARNDYSDALMAAGRAQEAAEHLREAVRLYPEYADAHANLGNALTMLGRPQEAMESFERALALEPDLAIVHYNMACLYETQGRIEDMEKQLRRALEVSEKMLPAHNDLGNLLLRTGRVEEAGRHYRRALELRPGNTNALTSLGNVAYMQGRHAEAADYFRQALARNPDLVEALTNCAFVLATTRDESLRDVSKGVEMAERAARLSARKDPAILSVLASAYANAGRFPDAIEAAKQGIAIAESQGNTALVRSLRDGVRAFEQGRTGQ